MKIMIDDIYGICSDENNYILFELKTRGEKAKNVGEVVESNVGYYGTIQAALSGMLRFQLDSPTKMVIKNYYKSLMQ